MRHGDEAPPGVVVELADGFNPEIPDVFLEIHVDGGLPSDEYEDLKEVIVAWYRAGFMGGYGSGFHFLSDVELEVGNPSRVLFWVDMGSRSSQIGIEVLVRMLDLFNSHPWRGFPPAKRNAVVLRLIVGGSLQVRGG